MADELEDLRHKVALSCRMLAMMGMVKASLGHVSARIPGTEEMFVRCRALEDIGLPFVADDDIRRGPLTTPSGGDMGEGYRAVGEIGIHGELMQFRPEVNCVIHAHPPGALMIGLSDVALKPILGAYDSGASTKLLLREGYAIFPHSYLISRPELAHKMLAVMGARNTLIMRGHGVTIAGESVEDATARAICFEAICRISWQLAAAGKTPPEITEETLEEFTAGWARGGFPGSAEDRERNWTYWEALMEKAQSLPHLVGLDHVMI
jgi:ribulose-5-phosphate 4-epimerase/fuculose-1-phosphate aldolase